MKFLRFFFILYEYYVDKKCHYVRLLFFVYHLSRKITEVVFKYRIYISIFDHSCIICLKIKFFLLPSMLNILISKCKHYNQISLQAKSKKILFLLEKQGHEPTKAKRKNRPGLQSRTRWRQKRKNLNTSISHPHYTPNFT